MKNLQRLYDMNLAILRDGSEAGAGAGEGDKKPAKKPNGRAADDDDDGVPAGYFSREYVTELRAENKGYRLKATEQQRLREEAEKKAADAEKAAKEAETVAQKKAEQRLMRAELKALALKEGMIDLDGLSFIDYTTVSFDDKGDLKGGPEAIAKLKEAKPYLFGAKSTTSPKSASPDPKSSTEPVDARKLTADEYKALKAKMGIRV